MTRRSHNYEKIPVSVEDLTARLAALCPEHHIDLAGAVALPCPLPHRQAWLDWVAADRHGGLDYLIRDPEDRADPTRRNPWAGALLVFAQRYTNGWPAKDPAPASGGSDAKHWTDRVARYARGQDYHDVLLKDIKQVLAGLKQQWPDLAAFPATDTGPYLEREYAWLAGFGFLGRNTCLIHEQLGSGIFLGVALTNLQILGLPTEVCAAPEPLYAGLTRSVAGRAQDSPVTRCGSCTRCVDACPTGALSLGGGLDANLCLSTWTIEWQGQTPAEHRSTQGGILFGCDICQAVCPWNQKAATKIQDQLSPVRSQYDVLPAHETLKLEDLIQQTPDDFRSRFRRTPLWRCHCDGLQRNARVVIQNLEEKP